MAAITFHKVNLSKASVYMYMLISDVSRDIDVTELA